ncbi:S26 family signal peptidase [Pseudoscardovia radai]|uniref:Signal peptidase I n=1 Tax=Pseudoscardovia radai TaxID=987066 RepID=A0A261F024_9BIFI|nr:signal peptidase I [Pseudoscardovia radai]OZG52457.1 S26 family signal peptidase [Pseudoscardovia radai]
MDDLDTMRAVAGTDDDKREDEGAMTGAASGNGADDGKASGKGSRRRRKKHAQDEDDAQGVGVTLREILNWLVVPVLIVVVLRCFVFGMYVIPSGSMETTLEINDRVVTSRIAAERGDIKRGDVIVFEDPADWLSGTATQDGSDYLIKRVIGLPGDVVACDGDGAPVTVNGMAIDESSYLKAGVEPSEFSFSVTVTDGNLFVMGDNRANSADSRYHRQDGNDGLVPESKVVGVALAVYWPFADMKTLQNHEDVFANVPAASGASSPGGTQ